MHEYYLTFQSLTIAQHASKMLKRHGISAPVVSTPASLTSEGCGYSVGLKARELERAKRYLEQMKIPYRNVFFSGMRWPEDEML